MASSGRKRTGARRPSGGTGRGAAGLSYTASDIARLENDEVIPRRAARGAGLIHRRLSLRETTALFRAEESVTTRKVVLSVVVLAVLAFLSLGVMGASGQYYPYTEAYDVYSPAQVAAALFEHAYNAVGEATHLYSPHSNQWILDNVPGYWGIAHRAGVIAITLICAALLSVSGMLYQSAFKNPLAGPSMLGVSSGVSLGMMLLVALYGGAATSMIAERYALCYGFGAAILLFVILAGKKLSGRGKPYDIVTMLLIGSIVSQLLGFVVQYVTLFVMTDEEYLVYFNLVQMLTVDTSLISWVTLGIAACASFLPIYVLRFRLNGLSFDQAESRPMGIESTGLRALALICGAIMILAAQVHVGMVGLVSLIVPFLARGWFGCEFTKQLTGSVCIGAVLLLVCRDIADLIPFVGDGLAIGSVASIVALPLFLVVACRYMKEWE